MAFGKPKKKKPLEVGKPRDVGEKYEVKRRLREKYPDMVNKTGPWAPPSKRKKKKSMSVSAAVTQRKASQKGALSGATAEEERKRLSGG